MSFVQSDLAVAASAQAPQREQDIECQAVLILARARAECVALGLDPLRLGELFLEEASLAWLVGGLDDAQVRARLDVLVDRSVRPWLAQLRHRAGVCDCVAEVHFEALCAASRNPITAFPRD